MSRKDKNTSFEQRKSVIYNFVKRIHHSQIFELLKVKKDTVEDT